MDVLVEKNPEVGEMVAEWRPADNSCNETI